MFWENLEFESCFGRNKHFYLPPRPIENLQMKKFLIFMRLYTSIVLAHCIVDVNIILNASQFGYGNKSILYRKEKSNGVCIMVNNAVFEQQSFLL